MPDITEQPAAKAFDWASRRKASLVHLAISASLALLVAAVVFVLWFPGDYRQFSGGAELFSLVVGVDLSLGPLITLVIFDRRKPIAELARDIAIVATLQLAALVYGLHMVSISRPVALALEENRFRVVAEADVYLPELPGALPEFRHISLTGPVLLRSLMPQGAAARSDALDLALKGHDIGTRPVLWRPWDAAARREALDHAKPATALANRYPGQVAELGAAAGRTGRALSVLVYIPMITFRGDWVALLDAGSGDVVGYAPFDGF